MGRAFVLTVMLMAAASAAVAQDRTSPSLSVRDRVLPIQDPGLYASTLRFQLDSEESLTSIVAYIADASLDPTERQDLAREFVFTNSIHGEGEPYEWDIPTVLDMLWEAHANDGPLPIIACGPRAAALLAIYDRLGYTSNLVSIFTDAGTDLSSHTFVEVYNAADAQWEIQDPDFGVYYVLTSTGRRLQTQEMLTLNLNEVTPMSPRDEGWLDNNVDHLRMMYFELAVYYPRVTTDSQQHWIYVNNQRMDLDRPLEDTGQTYREYLAERYTGSRILLSSVMADSNQ